MHALTYPDLADVPFVVLPAALPMPDAGNSGGPLLDLSGLLIGVNTAIFTNTGTSAGLGFAIPSNTVRRVVPQLIQYGAVQRASLGFQPAPDPIARAFKISSGVLIQTADPKGAAVAAGLLPTRRGLGGIVAGSAWLVARAARASWFAYGLQRWIRSSLALPSTPASCRNG